MGYNYLIDQIYQPSSNRWTPLRSRSANRTDRREYTRRGFATTDGIYTPLQCLKSTQKCPFKIKVCMITQTQTLLSVKLQQKVPGKF